MIIIFQIYFLNKITFGKIKIREMYFLFTVSSQVPSFYCVLSRVLRYLFIAAIQRASECTMPLQDRRFRSSKIGDADR